MSSQKFVPLSEDDVIRGINPILGSHTTFTAEDLLEKLRENLRISDRNSEQFEWIGEGMECELLRARGNDTGWKAGKIRIHVEFVEEDFKPHERREESSLSSLDELRSDV